MNTGDIQVMDLNAEQLAELRTDSNWAILRFSRTVAGYRVEAVEVPACGEVPMNGTPPLTINPRKVQAISGSFWARTQKII